MTGKGRGFCNCRLRPAGSWGGSRTDADLAKTYYYRSLNPAEATQWNDIFNAVILS